MPRPTPIVPDILPSADEGVDVVDGGAVAPGVQPRALKEGMVVALHDAPPSVLDVVGQFGLRAPERRSRGSVPLDHAEAKQGRALREDAVGGLRHFTGAHVSKKCAIPTSRGGAGLAAAEIFVFLPAGIPFEFCELPIRDWDVGATLGIDAVLACPRAFPDRGHVWHGLVNFVNKPLHHVLVLIHPADRGIVTGAEFLGLPRRILK
mmetsp:Transcript_91521/g.179250  ORF Transcript_91521/g.179250 Transcript_91521/m.179250 type:complete len:206 (-) Transcript_91521:367-984(-)